MASEPIIPKEISKAVETIAKGLGVAVTELWSIFVRQYLVRGITEAFTGVVLCIASLFLFSAVGLWILIPLAVALGFFYGAILLIGNPKYYALQDITKRVTSFTKSSSKNERKYY